MRTSPLPPVPPDCGEWRSREHGWISDYDATHPSTGLLQVFDATPVIRSVSQPTVFPNGQMSFTIQGNNFGSTQGAVRVCAYPAASGDCTTDPTWTVAQISWGAVISVLLTPPPTASGSYCLQVASVGASGSHFLAAPNGETTDASACVQAVAYYTISGRVTTADGKGVSGITMDPQQTIRTDANGNYSMTVTTGGSYYVTPSSPTYWFSPKNATFTNITSNQSANFTATPVTYVYLIHGIGQTAAAMVGLKANLQDPSVGVDLDHYHIDAGFTFGCATSCGGACSVQPGQTLINLGAQWLASYIQQQGPRGNIILIGYSMGGLVARDLIANNYGGALTGRPVTALITLGTPNLGYPYSSFDENVFCRQLVLDMSGSFDGDTNGWRTSPYLDNLRGQWVSASYSGYWMAAAGEQCANQFRNLRAPGEDRVGCPKPTDLNPSPSVSSDGVVCRDSAIYGFGSNGFGVLNAAPKPSVPWTDSGYIYVHTNSWAGWGTAGILCGNSGDPSVHPQIFDPPNYRTLFPQIKAVISAH